MKGKTTALPGLEHLISVLKTHGVGVDPHPPNPEAPRAGELVLGEPFDPILAEVYARFDGGRFGDFILFSTKHPDGGLVKWNADSRERAEHRLQKIFRYGEFEYFAYDFATVPSLAGADGIQPVVFLDNYMIKLVLPIASSADRAFDLYARYCEARFRACGALRGEFDFEFPYSFVEDIARDRELVRMIEEKHFIESFVVEPDEQEFVEKILQAARAQS